MIAKRRVAIVGAGVISPLGHSMDELWENLLANKSSVVHMAEWADDPKIGLSSSLASPVGDINDLSIPRKFRRSMSRVARLSHLATKQAIENAALSQDMLSSERTGVFYGSCMGGLEAVVDYYNKAVKPESDLCLAADATTYLRMMPQTCAANIAVAFQVGGRIVPSSTACAASTQAIGFGYEAIKYGLLDRALCGGAEELSATIPAMFDVLGAIEQTKQADLAPKPFDAERSGIVVGEGAGTIVLEEYEQALERGAPILGELVAFYTNSDASHMTNPSPKGLARAMEGALYDWGEDKKAADIDYINAHATGTINGDRAESVAIESVFGNRVPLSSTKGSFGHLMGGTGVVETIGSIAMLKHNCLLPTKNLSQIDPECAKIDYIKESKRIVEVNTVMKNSFAFGGVNACLIINKV